MSRNQHHLHLLATCLFTAATHSQALPLNDKALELYGTLHASLDYLDSDISIIKADESNTDALSAGDMSISYNSSLIGLRGEMPTDIEQLHVLYQMEQSVNPDGATDTLNTRNSFLGLKGSNWNLLIGRYDTLFKDLALRHSLIKHSVADRGAILGASALNGNQLDKRAENMILGRIFLPAGQSKLELQLQYSTETVKSPDRVDNNKQDLISAGVEWKSPRRILAAAYDHWSALDIKSTTGNIDAYRMVWKETGKQLTTSVILESIKHTLTDGSAGEMERDAAAFQIGWKQGSLNYLAQVIRAGNYAGISDSGATMWSAGLERSLSTTTQIYGMATVTDNEANARYQGVDGTHGDKLATLNGRAPRALSAGMIFRF